VLSQNTSGENCARAYQGLTKRFEVTPWALAKADEKEIKKAIRPGGLHNIKARRIREIAQAVIDRWNGDLRWVLEESDDRVREELTKLPGVGDKTADVLLAHFAGRRRIPIDTHMNRIAKRLGIVSPSARYEEIEQALVAFLPPDKVQRGSGLLWLLAKHTCKARRPQCGECPLRGICAQKETG
jgi:endonuclease-3